VKLIFERENGALSGYLSECEVSYRLDDKYCRENKPQLPGISEGELCRHYTELANNTFGINNGFYPLGSCTMKYNPKINEKVAALPGFTEIHPLQQEDTVSGAIEAMELLKSLLCEITGMDGMTLQPAAGAHGEFMGLLLIKAYHKSRNDNKRTKIIVPDSAHGTNPASTAMAGFEMINMPSTKGGLTDIDKLREAVGEDTAGLMLTNPNTLGLFDKNILEITDIIHQAGGLNYYDGANLNAIMGIARPGDMGFDIVHVNLHKTFSTPHGGGGPGSGPVGCKSFLAQHLPGGEKAVGRLTAFYGNFLVAMKALTYILSLGCDGLLKASQTAVLCANYMKSRLSNIFDMAYNGYCMHEFVMSLERLKKETGVSALDFAKALLDEGIHPPTMYFPLIVNEALMAEPTETESKEGLDKAIEIFTSLYNRARSGDNDLKKAPQRTYVSRVDEATAARNPILHA
jgi:glycine dehydrogenase subunit 2